MEMDIRSITYKPAEEQVAADSQGQAADEGLSAADDTGTSTPAPVEITEDDTYLTAEVHLMGTPQSLEMIVLRPTRNRTGSAEDAAFAATESDRRRVGYMFSTGVGGPGLYYRNDDQQYELLMEQEGSPLDPVSQYMLLAPEVADLTFQYLDGATNTWVDQWNSRDLAALPRAIKITMLFHSSAMASTNALRTAPTHVSTEIFQAVVHLPLSDAPLEL
jgi:hypothetical protein